MQAVFFVGKQTLYEISRIEFNDTDRRKCKATKQVKLINQAPQNNKKTDT